MSDLTIWDLVNLITNYIISSNPLPVNRNVLSFPLIMKGLKNLTVKPHPELRCWEEFSKTSSNILHRRKNERPGGEAHWRRRGWPTSSCRVWRRVYRRRRTLSRRVLRQRHTLSHRVLRRLVPSLASAARDGSGKK